MEFRFLGNHNNLNSGHLEDYTHCAFFHNRFTRTVPNKSHWVLRWAIAARIGSGWVAAEGQRTLRAHSLVRPAGG